MVLYLIVMPILDQIVSYLSSAMQTKCLLLITQ
jgi:hypothetical protein